MPRDLELLQQENKIVHRGLAFSGGARREEGEARSQVFSQSRQQFVPGDHPGWANLGPIIPTNSDHDLHLRDFTKFWFPRTRRFRQWDDDAAPLYQREHY